MKEIIVFELPPTGIAVTTLITSECRSMEAGRWDLHVSKTYVGINSGAGEGLGVQEGERALDATGQVPVHRSPQFELLCQLRDNVRKRHYSIRTEEAYSD